MFNPSQSPQTSNPEKKREVVIPPDIAWPIQIRLCIKYFQNQYGKPFTDVDDEIVMWWADTYGKAFRVFCDNNPDVAEKIITGTISEEEEADLVFYIQGHPEKTFH